MSGYDLGDRVVCIKEYETLKLKSTYSIKGMGDLSWNMSTDKKGPGYCVEDDHGDWKLPYMDRIKWYYFTEEEMVVYFITEDQDYNIYLRDRKINEVLK